MIQETAALSTAAPQPDERTRFARTLVRVMTVQVVTLLVLWLLQTRYTS